jgi:hypothetical protein
VPPQLGVASAPLLGNETATWSVQGVRQPTLCSHRHNVSRLSVSEAWTYQRILPGHLTTMTSTRSCVELVTTLRQACLCRCQCTEVPVVLW